MSNFSCFEVDSQKYLDITKVNYEKRIKYKDTFYSISAVNNLKKSKNRLDFYYSFKLKDLKYKSYIVGGRHYVKNYSCGNFMSEKGSYACPDHIQQSIKHHSIDCNKLGCPVCYLKACSRRTKNIVARLWATKLECEKNNMDVGFPVHISLNPEKNIHLENYEEFNELRKDALAFAEFIGLLGGVLYGHPVRIDMINELLYESHHFHTLGFGFAKESQTFNFFRSERVKEFEIKIKKAREKGNSSEVSELNASLEIYKNRKWRYQNHGRMYNRKDLAKRSTYNLSHVGLWFETKYRKRRADLKEKLKKKIEKSIDASEIKELKLKLIEYHKPIKTEQHKNSYVYYGICHPAKSKVLDVKIIEKNCECPICSKELYRILSGVILPMINNPKNEIISKFMFDIGSIPKLHDIEKDKVVRCNCEICNETKSLDEKYDAGSLAGNHYCVDKSLPVIISGKVEFNYEDIMINLEKEIIIQFKNLEKIKNLIDKSRKKRKDFFNRKSRGVPV